MAGQPEISTLEDANAARERASQTQTDLRKAFAKSFRANLTDQERSENEQELSRLRRQHKAEIEPVRAFYRELVTKAEERINNLPAWKRARVEQEAREFLEQAASE